MSDWVSSLLPPPEFPTAERDVAQRCNKNKHRNKRSTYTKASTSVNSSNFFDLCLNFTVFPFYLLIPAVTSILKPVGTIFNLVWMACLLRLFSSGLIFLKRDENIWTRTKVVCSDLLSLSHPGCLGLILAAPSNIAS